MRTSLTRLNTIEEFVAGTLSPEDKILFIANLQLDEALPTDVADQRKAYAIIRRCSRQQMKSELDQLHHHLMTNNKTFLNRILAIFQKN